MKRFFISMLGFGNLAMPVIAQSWIHDNMPYLSASEQQHLIDAGELTGLGASLKDLTVWRSLPFADSVLTSIADGPGTIAAEALFILDRPPAVTTAELDLKIANSLTAFSTMKGLLVYSDSQKKMETFIFDSFRVDSLATRHPLADPAYSIAPQHGEYTLYQKEEQTGDVYSTMTIDVSDNRVEAMLTNLTDLDFLGLRLVAPGQLKTLFVVMPTGGKIVLYGVTVANTPHLFGLERIKQKSFFYRMKALASWFGNNLKSQVP